MLRIVACSAAAMGAKLVLFDFAGEFEGFSPDGADILRLRTYREMYDWCEKDFLNTFRARDDFRGAERKHGLSDEELYDRMQKFQKLIILVGNLPALVNLLDNPPEGEKEAAGFFENILSKGSNRNVWWFGCANPDDCSAINGSAVYRAFVSGGNGIHFGGNVAAQQALDFEYVRFNERSKLMKAGIGLLPQREDETALRVVVPLCRK